MLSTMYQRTVVVCLGLALSLSIASVALAPASADTAAADRMSMQALSARLDALEKSVKGGSATPPNGTQYSAVDQQLAQLTADNLKQAAKLKALTASVADLKTSIGTVQTAVAALQSPSGAPTLASLQASIEGLTQNLNMVQGSLASDESSLGALGSAVTGAQSQLANLSTNYNTLAASVGTDEGTIGYLQSKLYDTGDNVYYVTNAMECWADFSGSGDFARGVIHQFIGYSQWYWGC